MNIEVSGRNYEVTDKVRKLISTKLDKVEKFFEDIIEARCVLKVEKKSHICEIHIHGRRQDVDTTQTAESMDDAIQLAVDHLKRQAQKNRAKIKDLRKGRTAPVAAAAKDWKVRVLQPGRLRTDDSKPRIIKTSKLPIRPMSIEQAALMLDDSKNEFIVFRDLDTSQITVLYKRKDNNFGMIAEF
jgi:putative sigma-54 modulation protein